MRWLSLTVAMVVAGSACSSHYMPRAIGRVSIVMQAGQPVYVRDGVVVPQGFLGSGLEQAVVGNPAAQAAARRFHDGWRDAFIEVFLGGLAMGTGTGLLTYEATSTNAPPRLLAPSLGLLVVGAALMMWGGLEVQDAQTYQWDAINIFNDNPMPAPVLPAASGAWSSGSVPNATLQMR